MRGFPTCPSLASRAPRATSTHPASLPRRPSSQRARETPSPASVSAVASLPTCSKRRGWRVPAVGVEAGLRAGGRPRPLLPCPPCRGESPSRLRSIFGVVAKVSTPASGALRDAGGAAATSIAALRYSGRRPPGLLGRSIQGVRSGGGCSQLNSPGAARGPALGSIPAASFARFVIDFEENSRRHWLSPPPCLPLQGGGGGGSSSSNVGIPQISREAPACGMERGVCQTEQTGKRWGLPDRARARRARGRREGRGGR